MEELRQWGKLKILDLIKELLLYDEGLGGRLSSKFYKLLLNQIELGQGTTVLDVGCGTGTILKKIDESDEINGFGIDIEENMIIEAKQKCQKWTSLFQAVQKRLLKITNLIL